VIDIVYHSWQPFIFWGDWNVPRIFLGGMTKCPNARNLNLFGGMTETLFPKEHSWNIIPEKK